MENVSVGISDLEIYVPGPEMDLDRLYAHRIAQDPSFARRLRRAIDSTGQKSFRFPEPWEDSATLAAQSAQGLLKRNGSSLNGLRYLATGTETAVDQYKPMAAYVEGMLQTAGIGVPESLMTFQAQHACAGGTIAMLGIAGMLAASQGRKEAGLVISADIARYDTPSTAEITQGAGAISILVENNPRLMELDLDTTGLCSRDVDDFFRPNGSVTAKVKGGYSIQCYNEALDAAFHDHCNRRGEKPADVLNNTDMFILHVPFRMMALTALQRLVSHHLGIHGDELQAFVNNRGFEQSLEPNARVGNLYTASTLLALSFLLKERYALLWLAASVFGLIIGVFPQIIVYLADTLRFQYLTVFFVMSFVFGLGLVLAFSVVISRLVERNRRLTQEVALLSHTVKELERKRSN